ncbi:Lrp/AsnC family transcriptional regulator [Shimia marina]|uniref:Leucine-responsive regulatory protein n=1 Tax=Shimia marina TaxID=321267 RepID=A0A0N7LRF7_9RHOB|nr:Lrp/AsnC family transcriptional regulator [Shimia marina]CUH50692.1 Leucine-responsive regulatory protein [Shimia marina]SFE36664.1 Lrp/AsnC family transcriptional regulator, leucine-responsive regulatory protein [Shimia marina]
MPDTLDDIDRRLLSAVQKNTRLTADELGEIAGISRSAVQRRLAGYRAEGIIEAEIAVVSAKAVGRPMTFLVEVEMERERTDLLDEFRRSMLTLDDVQQCYYVTGQADFILVVTAQDMGAYEEFSRRVFNDNPNIRRFHSNVVIDRVKAGLQVPLS